MIVSTVSLIAYSIIKVTLTAPCYFVLLYCAPNKCRFRAKSMLRYYVISCSHMNCHYGSCSVTCKWYSLNYCNHMTPAVKSN